MKRTLAASMTLVLMGTAHAGTLITPPLVVQSPDSLICQIANVGSRPRLVVVEVIDINGDVLGGTTQTLQPKQVAEVGVGAGFQVPRYCKFGVEGKSKLFRASGSVTTTFGSSVAAVSAYALDDD